jgi:hypothetical protein
MNSFLTVTPRFILEQTGFSLRDSDFFFDEGKTAGLSACNISIFEWEARANNKEGTTMEFITIHMN